MATDWRGSVMMIGSALQLGSRAPCLCVSFGLIVCLCVGVWLPDCLSVCVVCLSFCLIVCLFAPGLGPLVAGVCA